MATETTNYKFKKPDNTDFYNIADQNGNWDKCDKQLKALDDGKAATTHEHTKAEITDFPTKLPANGGDADTVGGKNVSDLLLPIVGFGGGITNYPTTQGVYRCTGDVEIVQGASTYGVLFITGTGYTQHTFYDKPNSKLYIGSSSDGIVKPTDWVCVSDNGNATTLCGKDPSAFLNAHSQATDITWDPTTYPLGCWSAEGSLSTAHGHPVTSPSLHITYYMTGQTNDANGYRTLLAITADGRMFLKVQQWTVWSAWIDLKDATTLGGLTADKFMQYDVNNLATVNKLGGVNGGRLAIQRGDTNFTLGDAYVDYYDDSVRFWSARGGQAVGAKMKISDIPDNNFRNVALFTAGTTDVTPGVTNLGKNMLYIKYKA